jgi:hypothetical protein
VLTEADNLQTIAEVSVALAGFGTVVVVLRRAGDQFHPADAFRVFNALVPSIAAGFLALVPLGLDLIGVQEARIWRTVSFLFAAVVAALSLSLSRRMRGLPRDSRSVIPSRVAATNFIALCLAAGACLINGTTALLGPPQGGFYFFGILVLLGIGAVAFVRLVFIRPAA